MSIYVSRGTTYGEIMTEDPNYCDWVLNAAHPSGALTDFAAPMHLGSSTGIFASGVKQRRNVELNEATSKK